MNVLTFDDVFPGQPSLHFCPEKQTCQVSASRSGSGAGAGELASTYFPPQKSLVVMTRLERLQVQTEEQDEQVVSDKRNLMFKHGIISGFWRSKLV